MAQELAARIETKRRAHNMILRRGVSAHVLALHPVAHEGVWCIVIDPSPKQKQWREDSALGLVGTPYCCLASAALAAIFMSCFVSAFSAARRHSQSKAVDLC